MNNIIMKISGYYGNSFQELVEDYFKETNGHN